MKTNIQAVNFEMTKKLEEYINKKLSRFSRHLADDDEVVIRMNVVKPQTKNNKQVKVQIAALFAEKTCDTFEEAFSSALEALEGGLEKRKEQ
ncbi:MAG: ribosome-associated translation inhibitor RaiA [Bacteroidaceae bacterium]|nr:ribosome-associated translation inhibitor RaiA [Bacteroidaceae bacterium]MBR6819770.1 ribosome-associated translation inhibitor RaiA [Bacteroidaceae bacterium]MBR7052649.1 ribosome-associated translation inhibitor RaiA [Bacteroidaceae bacterium]